MRPYCLSAALENVRSASPLVHCITNYVTVNDCANVLLACGASPIMSDEPEEVAEITSICNGLVLNIGTLSKRTIEAMLIAGQRAAELGHPIVLDPVGAGASSLRTETSTMLLEKLPVAVVRGNMSEIKALAGASSLTRGVDVNPEDVVTDENLASSAQFARMLAKKAGAVVAITGAIDVVADANRAYAVRNGSPLMGRITGAGCMLTCLVAAFVAANPDDSLEAVVAAVTEAGMAGQIAAGRMSRGDGNASFRGYMIDSVCNMTEEALERGALVERVL